MNDTGFNPDVFNAPASSMQAFIKQYVPEDDDSGCIASFDVVREYQPFKSKEAGSDIFEDRTYIRINIRGNDKLEVHRPATDADKKRFPFIWQQFQKGEQAAERGTHLSKLSGVDASMIRQLHAKNVYTIEDLAKVDDNNLPNLGAGARELRGRARDFVDNGASGKPNAKLAEMQQQLDQQSRDLAKALEIMANQQRIIDSLSRPAAIKRKTGPKPKPKEQGENTAAA